MNQNDVTEALTVKIKDNQLVISIGIDTLSYCFEESNINYDGVNEKKLFYVKSKEDFAKDIKLILTNEREDGSTLLTDMLDNSYQEALDDGVLSISFIFRNHSVI